jgi:carbon monoxide dehydrogenase subunit G
MHIFLALLAVLAPVGFSPAEVDAALRGQVPVRIEPFVRPDGKTAGRGMGAIVVERAPTEVWATLSRFEDKPEYMPRLKSLSILEQTPERMRVQMVVDASVMTARYTLVFRIDEPARCISWTLDHSAQGNSIADTEGEYRLYELAPTRTLVTYKSHVDTGRAVPRFIQNYMARHSIPDLLNAIKRRVESGGRWRR